ncbi:hypothetical protein DVV91_17260 [Clostridium botulinum]|uniref:hypothetical protein n=1 Tax=Clostridium botulinum TaxID=1491 RepID=UPI0019671826|nr:hypothetical protein [Clostridium botulinum]MBN1076071.1 hypothetical protein [Clostridium botulinum]
MSKVNNTLTTMKERKQQITKESEIYSGETRIMSCGELAFIAEYRSNKDITIQFKSTGELINTTYESFKNGEVKSHFTPTVYGIGVWCNYDAKEELKRISSKNGIKSRKEVEVFKNNKSLGVFESLHYLQENSFKLFGEKFSKGNISRVCNGKQLEHKGFTFKYL